MRLLAYSISSSRRLSRKVSSAAVLPVPIRSVLYSTSAARRTKMPGAPADEPAAKVEKSEKEKAKEKAKADKAAKFAAKQAKLKEQQQQQQNAASQKTKAESAASSNSKPAPAQPATLPPFVDSTPPGEKKILQSFEHPHFSAFNSQAVESSWYAWWEKSGFFQPEARPLSDKKFVIPLPPPNVTGALHCGHALANSLQDTLIRWYRMRGFTALWVPGCDHAGISTQSVVEKMLWKRQRKTRHDLGREDFTKIVWEWKNEYHEKINAVQRRMGGSMDWTREAFTMDTNLTAATMENFCRLHEEGYIYRSNRLVNWCTQLNTALSNLEVESKEINGRTLLDVPGYDKKVEFGVLTHFRYPIDGTDQFVEVATTRPETMLGDSGVAVHPDDKRYTHLVGKFARHPFTDRLMPIVADSYVDPEFGTGCVKLTPAHDFNDYELGKRHGLEFINILNEDGTLNHNAGPNFKGQKRFDARYTVVEELTKLGLFVKKEPNPMKIPLCEKSKDVIEPLMKPQWWVRMEEMAAAALKAADDGTVKISPESAAKSYQRWMSNVNDWCISRQLWWGHRIPAYRVVLEDQVAAAGDEEVWVVGRTAEEAQARAQAKFPTKKFRLEQDPDCLDTWFSSGLWPMATLGWPNTENPDFKNFFPTSLLETGWDILFFWVARMIMLSLKLAGSVPFTEVYCHSLVRDSEGRKMSKSLGNVIDPVDIITGIDLESLHAKLYTGNLKDEEVERAKKYQKTAFPNGIPECGADALRFTLLSYTTGGGDINFDIKVMHAYRRFCNKIWQASKYVLGKLPEDFRPAPQIDVSKLTQAERWILHRMNSAVKGVNEALEAREFSKATKFAYSFIYDDFCDVFIENSKSILSDGTSEEQSSVQQTLYRALDVMLRLLHPIMPFITEELWQRLPRGSAGEGAAIPTIMLAPYPEFDSVLEFEADAADYELGLRCAQGVRSLAADYGVRTGGIAFVKTASAASHGKASAQAAAVRALCGKVLSDGGVLTVLGPAEATPPGCAVFFVAADTQVLLQVGALITDVNAEIKKLQAKLVKSTGTIQKQQELMTRDGFEKVSDVVVDAERKKLADAEAAKENYERTLEEFQKMKLSAENGSA